MLIRHVGGPCPITQSWFKSQLPRSSDPTYPGVPGKALETTQALEILLLTWNCKRSSWLLAFPWPSPGCCGSRGNEPVDGRSDWPGVRVPFKTHQEEKGGSLAIRVQHHLLPLVPLSQQSCFLQDEHTGRGCNHSAPWGLALVSLAGQLLQAWLARGLQATTISASALCSARRTSPFPAVALWPQTRNAFTHHSASFALILPNPPPLHSVHSESEKIRRLTEENPHQKKPHSKRNHLFLQRNCLD